MHLLEVRLFGEFAATDHRRNALAIGNKRTQALLAYLALRIDEGGDFEEIGRLFFDDADDSTHISRLIRDLRHALRHLSPELVIVDGQSVRLKREFNRAPSPETQRLHDEIIATVERLPAPREVFRAANERPVLVLLLEDDAVSSAPVEGFLTEAGYAVVAVADGADAVFEIGRHQFDLLILDINVPTLSGLRLFEIMSEKGIDTPAVFITGIAGAEEEARGLEMGATDFLRKPIRKETLLPRIRTILQRRTRAVQKP